jgi:hypothetical protein
VITLKADVDQNRARRAGVTSKDVADTLNFFVDGSTVTNYQTGNVEIPIVGRGVKAERDSPDSLRTLGIRDVIREQRADQPGGRCVHRGRAEPDRALQSGAHHHRQRQKPGIEGFRDFCRPETHPGGMTFPKNHYWEVGGELEDSAKAQKNLMPNGCCPVLAALSLCWCGSSIPSGGPPSSS